MELSQEQQIKLESMQIKGIRRMIWKNIEKNIIESRLLSISGQGAISDLNKFINSQNRTTLIKLIKISPEITSVEIDEAYEKYRYGLKPGFTLFWVKRNINNTVTKEELEQKLKIYLSMLQFEDDAKFKDLKYTANIVFDDVYEISLTYLQRLNYIDPNSEFTYIYMMKECFVWVGINRNFIAINNMPEVLMNSIKRFFSQLYNADITNIKITNSLLKTVFSTSNTKRITRHNSNPPENQLEKITVADPELSKKMSAIPSGYENYDVTNTQYIEDIDSSTTGTLGVNCNKGKLYLSKTLTSTQFRNWSTRRINEIIGYYENITDDALEDVSELNMFTSSQWEGIKSSSLSILNEIAYILIKCKRSGIDNYPITIAPHKVYTELKDYFYEKTSFICDVCEEKAIPACVKCGSSLLAVTKRPPFCITCPDCGERQTEVFKFICEKGHISSFENIDELVELIAMDSFTQKMFDTIHKYYSDISFDKGEYFTITISGLTIMNSPSYEKLKPSDIKEFAMISKRSLICDYNELSKVLYKMKEKCNHPTNENCIQCKNSSSNTLSDIGCILKLFKSFEGFNMQPHHGHEFGDVSMLVSLNGTNRTFIGIAKSGKDKITKASQTGREIIEQVISAFVDDRAEIIGVIYPGIIDNQLKQMLYNEAKVHNKSLVIMDNDFMIKMLDYYLEENSIVIKK